MTSPSLAAVRRGRQASRTQRELQLPRPARSHSEPRRTAVLENLDLQSRRAARDDLQRAFRGVVRTRKMDEHESRHSRLLKPRGHVGRLLIGQVTEWSSDALLEPLWVRPRL